jgi:hypothetical protein
MLWLRSAVILLILGLFFCAGQVSAWTDINSTEYQDGGIDTVIHGEYTLIFHYGTCAGSNGIAGVDILLNKDTLFSFAHCDITFYDFCLDSMIAGDGCIFKDINNDGAPEFIINICWGGMHCCNESGICTLGENARTLSTVFADVALNTIKDIDNDSIPEFINCNIHWGWWNREKVWGGNCPPLISKWDGDQMHLANFNFPDYILEPIGDWYSRLREQNQKNPNSQRELLIKYPFNPNDSPYSDLFTSMALYAYAGKIDMVDSVFNEFWPDDVPDKEDARAIFKTWLESDQWWKEIQKSNW